MNPGLLGVNPGLLGVDARLLWVNARLLGMKPGLLGVNARLHLLNPGLHHGMNSRLLNAGGVLILGIAWRIITRRISWVAGRIIAGRILVVGRIGVSWRQGIA